MKLKIAIQMDDISTLKYESDSTFLLGIEASRRGYEIFYYTPDHLSYLNGKIVVRAFPTKFFEVGSSGKPYHLGGELLLDLQQMDVVLLRQDPPFDMAYITTTYLLEMLEPKVLVINRPASVRNNCEKFFPTLFQKFMPPTLISADEKAISEFYKEQRNIILKPLYGYGGKGVLLLKEKDPNFKALLEMFFAESKEPIVAQKFLPEVASEEKRIILIDGEVAGVIGRIPEEGEVRANMRVGGQAVNSELTARQKQICEAVRPVLKDMGLILVGLDIIGDYLTEINITSPTGLRPINRLSGKNLEKDFWDVVEAKIR